MDKGVVVFSTTWCGPCKMLKKQLDDNSVEYTNIDAEENPEEFKKAAEISGRMGVPQMFVDGELLMTGYNAPAFKQWLDNNQEV